MVESFGKRRCVNSEFKYIWDEKHYFLNRIGSICCTYPLNCNWKESHSFCEGNEAQSLQHSGLPSRFDRNLNEQT